LVVDGQSINWRFDGLERSKDGFRSSRDILLKSLLREALWSECLAFVYNLIIPIWKERFLHFFIKVWYWELIRIFRAMSFINLSKLSKVFILEYMEKFLCWSQMNWVFPSTRKVLNSVLNKSLDSKTFQAILLKS
jgi:hypothetical protein